MVKTGEERRKWLENLPLTDFRREELPGYEDLTGLAMEALEECEISFIKVGAPLFIAGPSSSGVAKAKPSKMKSRDYGEMVEEFTAKSRYEWEDALVFLYKAAVMPPQRLLGDDVSYHPLRILRAYILKESPQELAAKEAYRKDKDLSNPWVSFCTPEEIHKRLSFKEWLQGKPEPEPIWGGRPSPCKLFGVWKEFVES